MGCKKQGHCYSKKGEARLPLLFLNNKKITDPVFRTLFLHFSFSTLFFQVRKPTQFFKTKIADAD